jgi:hypothetical protein
MGGSSVVSFVRFAALSNFLLFLVALFSMDVNSQTAMLEEPAVVVVQPSAIGQPTLLPENPKPPRVIDKKFIAIMGALGATESMRFTTRQLVLENEMAAGAPWVTSVPSHPHLVIKYAPIFLAELLVAYEIKKPHDWLPGDRVIRKFWWLYPAAIGTIHLHNALGNINTQPPAGCPAEECQQP